MAGLKIDPKSDEIQVRPLADGSVWVITSQAAYRWDGEAWLTVFSENEPVLASVDDSGRLWVLRQDSREISAWKDGEWTSYNADSGWMEAGYFEKNWWSPSPWSVVLSTDGSLWVPMAQDVRSFDGRRWSVHSLAELGFPTPEGEELSIVNILSMAQAGVQPWVGECYYSDPGPMGGGGVRWLEGQSWQGGDAPVGTGCVSVMFVDPTGNVWLGESINIWRYASASQAWEQYSLPKTLLSDFNFTHPLQLVVDESGDGWVIMQMCGGASCDGPVYLYRIHGGEWSLLLKAEYSGGPLKQLAVDANGQAWLFWEGTLYRLNDQPLEPFATHEASGVGVSPEGAIWVVAGSKANPGLYILEP